MYHHTNHGVTRQGPNGIFAQKLARFTSENDPNPDPEPARIEATAVQRESATRQSLLALLRGIGRAFAHALSDRAALLLVDDIVFRRGEGLTNRRQLALHLHQL